jgi:transcriptional regulator with XRE-family HTH domain
MPTARRADSPTTGMNEMARRSVRTTEEERKGAGEFLRDRRRDAGMTQADIARALGLSNTQTVYQIEAGKARVPPARYVEYATALKMDPKDFISELLRYYDREAWRILFDHTPE